MSVNLEYSAGKLTVEKKIPIYTFFEITRRCNLKCRHCYVSKERRRELSYREVVSIIDQLKEKNCLILNFSGGEVFMRKDFLDIARYARKNGFAVKIFTNGTLIDSRNADALAQIKPLRVEVTIFSVREEVHDSITGVKGSLKESLEALELLSKRNVRLRIKSTLMQENKDCYKEIISLAESLGAKYQFDLNIIPRFDGLKRALNLRLHGEDISRFLNDSGIGFDEGASFTRSDIICGAGHNSCAITAYGDLLPCITLPIKLGKLREESFSYLWDNSETLKKLRSIRPADLIECTVCSSSSLCQRCPGLAYLEDGDILGKSQRACELSAAYCR